MSLEPHWYSTIYGAMFGMGQVLSAFAFAIAVVLLLSGRPPLSERIGPAHLRDLGSLMMAFVMVWAYLSFCAVPAHLGGQPARRGALVSRAASRAAGSASALSLMVLHFALPFAILLSADVRSRTALACPGGVAGAGDARRRSVLADRAGLRPADAHAADEPAWRAALASLYAAALVGVGGLWLGVYLWQLRRPAAAARRACTIEQEEAHHG